MPQNGAADGGNILVFGGTTEGRAVLASGLPCVYSAATEYGAELAAAANGGEILSGRMDAETMASLMRRGDIAGVVDATHPYAVEVSRNIASACEAAGQPLFRVVREAAGEERGGDVVAVPSCAEAAEYLKGTDGNVLVTVGSKEMAAFAGEGRADGRFFFRVLPTSAVIRHCESLGVSPANLIAEQGPFSVLSNVAHIERTAARFLVTKDGGASGGVLEKLEAAETCGVKVLLIQRPQEERKAARSGTVEEAVAWARSLLGAGNPEAGGIVAGDMPTTARRAGERVKPVCRFPMFPMFPMFVHLEGKLALVIGGGPVAFRKAATLLKCGARLRVVAPALAEPFAEMAADARVEWINREYRQEDVRGAQIVVAATDDREVNRRAALDAGAIPVNVADAPGESSFYFPAFVEHDGYAAGISSAGRSPAHSRRLAARLRAHWKGWVEDVRVAE